MLQKIIHSLKAFLKNLLLKERTPKTLATAFCVGVYIAFSPFPGLHTAMVFASAWLFNLNIAVIFASSCLINNPWTMVPVYGADYMFGQWLCSTVLGLDMMQFNPWWMGWFNEWISQYINTSGFSLWSFLIGGNILGIGFALLLYPIMRYVFVQLAGELSDLLRKGSALP